MNKEREPYNPFEQTDEEEENFWNWLYPDLGDEIDEEIVADWFEVFKDGGLK